MKPDRKAPKTLPRWEVEMSDGRVCIVYASSTMDAATVAQMHYKVYAQFVRVADDLATTTQDGRAAPGA